MIIKCRFLDPDCDKSLYTCNDCKVILEFIDECKKSGADTRNITWLGQAIEILEQVVNVNPVTKSAQVYRP